jgi:hypothetical protein
MTFDGSELGGVARDLVRSATGMAPASAKALADEASRLVEDIAADTPVHTGALRDGFLDELRGPLTVDITNDLWWRGRFEEYGTSHIAPQNFVGANVDAAYERLADHLKATADAVNKAAGL